MSTSSTANPDYRAAPPAVSFEQDLRGKVAILTGATRGIGRAIAINLACRGCAILGTYSSTSGDAAITALNEELEQIYASSVDLASFAQLKLSVPKVVGLQADLLASDTPSRIREAFLANFSDPPYDSKLSILINNAAVAELIPFDQITPEDIQKTFNGNVQAPLIILKEVVDYFGKDSRIVNISSEASRLSRPGGFVYSATKAAMESFTRTWADILGQRPGMEGTTVNAVSVGVTRTGLMDNIPPERLEHFMKLYLPYVSVGDRIGEPEDIGDIVGWLTHEKSRWVTGTVVGGSGGVTKIL